MTRCAAVLTWTQSSHGSSTCDGVTGACDSLYDFAADAGILTLIGPLPEDTSCVLGEDCEADLEGFGLELKNNALISKRYPKYDRDVQQFIASDPLKSPRLALALAWLGAQDTYPVSIYIAHSMGGGAESYLQHRVKSKHHALGRAAVVIRVGGAMRWQIELHCHDGIISGGTNNLDYVKQLPKRHSGGASRY